MAGGGAEMHRAGAGGAGPGGLSEEGDQRHQGFGYKPPAMHAETAALVGLGCDKVPIADGGGDGGGGAAAS